MMRYPTDSPTLSPSERNKVDKLKKEKPGIDIYLVEKNGYRSVIAERFPTHPKMLERKGWYVKRITNS